MKIQKKMQLLFILGAIIDGMIAVSWFLIASGWNIPNILNGYVGDGPGYRLAMYIGAMFMAGWTVILGWGALKPIERRDLLIITSAFLTFSVIFEFLFFKTILGGSVFMFGVAKRLIISISFAVAWFYSLKYK
ncbi:MAG: hypothetical protein WBB19_11955 [Desulforhopalus sp.]